MSVLILIPLPLYVLAVSCNWLKVRRVIISTTVIIMLILFCVCVFVYCVHVQNCTNKILSDGELRRKGGIRMIPFLRDFGGMHPTGTF